MKILRNCLCCYSIVQLFIMFTDWSHSVRLCYGDHGSQLNTSWEWVIDIAIFWSFDTEKLYLTPSSLSSLLSLSFLLLFSPSFSLLRLFSLLHCSTKHLRLSSIAQHCRGSPRALERHKSHSFLVSPSWILNIFSISYLLWLQWKVTRYQLLLFFLKMKLRLKRVAFLDYST